MPPQAEPEDIDDDGGRQSRPSIAVHELTDRHVFTETGNTDGWIASDVTVDVDQ